MAHLFSRLAVLFGIPIALVRMFAAPFFYIFVYLFSVATNIRHYVFRNQANSLGFTARRNHTRSLCDQENNKLLDAWSASATSKVLFVTVEVHLSNSQTPEISEIALSWWSPGRSRRIQTSLWVIENGGFDAKEYNTHKPPVFLYGAAKKIQADEISIHLADIFQRFRKQFERVYLVGYKINKTLSLMGKAWALPQDIVTIDTERVWRAQNQDITELSFKQCIEAIPELREYSTSLGNAGNKAHLGIQLLRFQVQACSSESKVHNTFRSESTT